jgi:hypothetical protein
VLLLLLTAASTPVAATPQQARGASEAGGQAARSDTESAKLAGIRKQIDDSIDWFQLSTADPDATPLRPIAVLRWDNNQRGSELGLTVLYIGHGRAEAVCCIYPWQGKLAHEFSSLSRGPLEGRRDGQVVWSPDKPGVDFRTIPDAGAPADTVAARLRQLKTLAARFDAKLLGWKRDDSDRQALRQLPRPIYRYEQSTGNVLDGAVFAFVMGVDPEALLLIEAVSTRNESRWEYAFVRRTSGELEGRLDGNVVWTAERYPASRDPKGVYRGFTEPLKALEP